PTGTGSDWRDEGAAPAMDFWFGVGRFFSHALPRLCVAGALTLLMFRVFQPDAFVGSRPATPLPPELLNSPLRGLGFFDIRPEPRYLENLRQSAGFASGAIDWPPSVQWANRASYLFPLQHMIIWGMGIPLGVLAWIGWAAVGWQIVRRRWFAPLALWVWVSFYFAWQGAQFAKTMRYMLPIYGPLILFAAWLLVALLQQKQWGLGIRDWRLGIRDWKVWGNRTNSDLRSPISNRPWLRWSLVTLVVGGTFAWGYAFSRIYTRPHTRLTASRWVLDNVPPGSRIAYEHWDYALPTHADGRDPWVSFKGAELAPYAEDELKKYTGEYDPNDATKYNYGLLDQLDRNDYIVMSSNRIYDSIIQLPMRYPATIRYYRALFDGSLGWDLAADVTSYPSLLGVPIPDQSSEEAFTVYDHPRVLVFRKTASYSRANAEQLITSDMNWAEVYKITTLKGGKAPTALRFTPSQWPGVIAGGWWNSTFSLENLPQPVAVLLWLVVLELLGLAGFALLFHLLPMLPDRGFTLARALALLLVAYGAWLLGSAQLLPFSPLSVWLCALPLLA
ncbi:MAG: hypothetical protein H7Y32_11735, partial [Chloroflexales bacterium]|nr:hypothetical protein [Chloroflexales bacterium]